MAAVDFVEVAIEETPLNELTYDDAATPSRVSTDLLYPPARSARLAPTPQHLSRADELRGILGEVPRIIEGYQPAGILSGLAYAKDLTWLFELCGFTGARTAGNGAITDPDLVAVPTGASRWVFTKRNSLDARTGRIRTNYARENVLLEGYGFGVSQLSLNAAAEYSADLMGLFMRRLVADTVTVPAPVSATLKPFRRGDLYVSALAGGGRLGDFSLQIANPIERIASLSLNPSSDWPDALEASDGQVVVTGSIPKRILDADDYDALLNATSFAMTARWKSDDMITGAYPYTVWVQMPACQYVGGEPEELVGSRKRHGHTFDFFAAYDEASGYDCKITVVNNVTAITTGAT